jgi:hypothetical protein
MHLSNLTNPIWWKDAALRGLYTAVAIAVPYIGGSLIAGVPWLTAASAAAVGFIASLATSLFGLPEVAGVDLPWWLAAVERVVKTFFQAVASGLVGATLLSDVDWPTILQASLIAALLSLFRLILATLPNDPTIRYLEAAPALYEYAEPDAPAAAVRIDDAPARAPDSTESHRALG